MVTPPLHYHILISTQDGAALVELDGTLGFQTSS
jgi:hypothetical protein